MDGFRDFSEHGLKVDASFYEGVRAARQGYQLVERFVLPPLEARAFVMKRGHIVKIVQLEAPQAVELALWGLEDPQERYGAVRARIWEGVFISRFTRLWSEVPWLRPMMTCVEDTLAAAEPRATHYHRFWADCSPETIELLSGVRGRTSCRLNFLRTIRRFGLDESSLRENAVLFQKVSLDPSTGRFHLFPTDSPPGAHVEFFTEIDLIIAVSSCPAGDNAGGEARTKAGSVSPVAVEIFDTDITPKAFPKWTDWRPAWQGRWIPP